MALAIHTADRFFAILQKSGLLTEEQLSDVRSKNEGADQVRPIVDYLVEHDLLTAWQARKLQAGQHNLFLGKFKLLERLHWGDSQRVYLAQHTQMQSRVALKTLDRRQVDDPRTVEAFQKEGAIAAGLDHPNLIHVRDFDSEKNYYYLVMEYVEGEVVASRVARQGPLPPGEAAEVLAQAAAGLAHAHAQDVLHGDLRPIMLLLTSDGTAKILDLAAAPPDPVAGDGAGKRISAYAAPEVLADRAAGDARSDLYSLGAIFFYMLAGKAPPNAQKLQKAGDLSALRFPADAPQELVDICRKLLATDPAQRYDSARALADALQPWLEQHPAQPAAAAADAAPADRPVLKTREGATKKASSDFDLSIPATSAAARIRGPGRSRSGAAAKGHSDAAAGALLPWWRNRKIQLAIGGGAIAVLLLGLTVWLLAKSEPPAEAEVAAAPATTTQKKSRNLSKDESQQTESGLQFDFAQPGEAADSAPAAADEDTTPADAVMPAENPPAKDPPAEQPAAAPEEPAAKPKPEPAAPVDLGPQTPIAFHPVEMVRMTSPQGFTFERLQGTQPSYLVTGENSADASYELTAVADAPQITGVCIQALAHKSLPKSGPGRVESGDLHLARVRLYAGDSEILISSDEVELARAEADFSAKAHPVDSAIDAKQSTFWSIAPQVGKNHWAVFRTAQPIEGDGPTYLKLEIDHEGVAALGRFRIWAVTGTAPPPAKQFQDAPVDSPPAWNPFEGLAQAVETPPADEADAAQPISLGTVADDFAFSVELVGGTSATARGAFTMQPGAAGQWTILLHESPDATTGGTPVAQVKHGGGQLALQWTEQAKTNRDANYLMNCALRLAGSGKQHQIALRAPVEIDALPLKLEGRSNVKADIPWMPDPATVRVEIIAPEASFPPHDFDPGKQIAADEGTMWMRIGKDERLIHIKLDSEASARGIELTAIPHVKLDPMMKPLTLTRNTLQEIERSIGNAIQPLNLQIMRLEQVMKQAPKHAKARLETSKVAMEQQLAAAQAAGEKLGTLKELAASLAAAGHIPYRVLYQLDGQDVELARSAAPQSPAEN